MKVSKMNGCCIIWHSEFVFIILSSYDSIFNWMFLYQHIWVPFMRNYNWMRSFKVTNGNVQSWKQNTLSLRTYRTLNNDIYSNEDQKNEERFSNVIAFSKIRFQNNCWYKFHRPFGCYKIHDREYRHLCGS